MNKADTISGIICNSGLTLPERDSIQSTMLWQTIGWLNYSAEHGKGKEKQVANDVLENMLRIAKKELAERQARKEAA